MSAQSIAVDEALLALKIAFIVLLYLFIWRIVRSASRDLRSTPVQESVIISPGEEVAIDSLPVGIGRGGQNEVPLDADEFASAQHARFESRSDGLWVEDVGSTNGTFVNGARVTTPRRLSRGDVVRVGQTDFRVET